MNYGRFFQTANGLCPMNVPSPAGARAARPPGAQATRSLCLLRHHRQYPVAATLLVFYQRRFAEAFWPDFLGIPTSVGKAAAVLLAWLSADLERSSSRCLVEELEQGRLTKRASERGIHLPLSSGASEGEGMGEGIADLF